jgi:arylsulfatase A-like enzyme
MMPELTRPNILLFLSDQQQWRTVCGRSPARSPHVDRLAREGVRFERPYATVALCCPSRAALLSGQFPWHNGILNQVHVPERTRSDMVPDVQTYSERLRDAGYRLGYTGKWHVSWERTPLDFGFQDVRAPNGYNPATLRAAGLQPQLETEAKHIEVERTVAWPGSGPFVFYGIDHGPEEATVAHRATSAGIELIERYARGESGRPWFVTVNVVEPHDPYTPLATYAERYGAADVELPASWRDDFSGKPALNRREAGLWADLSEGQVRTAIARYWAFCEQVDAQVGRLLEVLDRTDQADDTLVVFSSDHGDMAGAHRQFIKGWQPYEETYRVPLMMRWPGGIAAGGVCDHLVQLHDLAHTFVDLAGADEPIVPADGRSLRPLLEDPAHDGWEDVAFCQYYGGEFLYTQRMVITRRHKYVFNAWDVDELYDLDADPDELHNAIDDPSYGGVRDELRERLYALMERHGDPYAQHRYGAARYLPRPSAAGT